MEQISYEEFKTESARLCKAYVDINISDSDNVIALDLHRKLHSNYPNYSIDYFNEITEGIKHGTSLERN